MTETTKEGTQPVKMQTEPRAKHPQDSLHQEPKMGQVGGSFPEAFEKTWFHRLLRTSGVQSH